MEGSWSRVQGGSAKILCRLVRRRVADRQATTLDQAVLALSVAWLGLAGPVLGSTAAAPIPEGAPNGSAVHRVPTFRTGSRRAVVRRREANDRRPVPGTFRVAFRVGRGQSPAEGWRLD